MPIDKRKYRYGNESYENPVCPVCGFDCETLYLSVNGEVLGCDNCIETKDAREWWEEHEEEMRYPDL